MDQYGAASGATRDAGQVSWGFVKEAKRSSKEVLSSFCRKVFSSFLPACFCLLGLYDLGAGPDWTSGRVSGFLRTVTVSLTTTKP
jgi:hypothetical protein